MRYIRQFVIIMLVAFMGELLNYLIPLPIPASIYGIIIMFFALKTNIIPLESVKETGKFLVEIMPIMFIPAAVGLVESWEIIRPSIFSYLFVTIITTVIVMAVSGRITQAIIRFGRKEADKND